jgi:enhancing lycopene biosynthesis protein 2
MKKFAVVLAGCGVYDGAEIHEAVLTLLAIDRAGAVYQCFAPDIPQHHVVNHITGKETPGHRNVLVESARIARGNIRPLHEFNAAAFDAIVFPGGFGAAKNLCTWALQGDECKVDDQVAGAIQAMSAAGKPIGAMCISPVILGKLLTGVDLTTGEDPASGSFIEKQGNRYIKTTHGQVVHDRAGKIFTTPCYMLDASITKVAEGTANLISEMMKVI